MNTDDCGICDCPIRDHGVFRYWFRPWWRHTVLRLVSKPLSGIQDTLGDI